MSYGSKVRFFSSTNEENQSKLSGGARNGRSAAWNASQRRFEWPQRRLERVATAGDLPLAANGIVWHNALCAPLSVVSPHCFANYFAHLPFGRAPRAASGPAGIFQRTTPRICLCGMRPLGAAALPVISRALHRAFAYAACGRWRHRPSQLFLAHCTAHLFMRNAPRAASGPAGIFQCLAISAPTLAALQKGNF